METRLLALLVGLTLLLAGGCQSTGSWMARQGLPPQYEGAEDR